MAKNRGKKRLSVSQIEAKKAKASKTSQNEQSPEVIPEDAAEVIEATAPQTKRGAPSKYKPEFAAVAAALCKRGATDYELSQEFGVSTSTIWRWSCQHTDFWNALHSEKAAFDARVERGLAARAIGYSFTTEKVFQFRGEIVRAETVEHVPPDVGAAKMWLLNRKPADWKESVNRVEVGGPGDFTEMSDDELQEYIAAEAKALQIPQHQAKRNGTKH